MGGAYDRFVGVFCCAACIIQKSQLKLRREGVFKKAFYACGDIPALTVFIYPRKKKFLQWII